MLSKRGEAQFIKQKCLCPVPPVLILRWRRSLRRAVPWPWQTTGANSWCRFPSAAAKWNSQTSPEIPTYSHYIMTSSNGNIFRVTGPFVRGIHRSPVSSPHKGQWRGGLMFSLICAWINACVNNRGAGDLRRHRTHYDVIVMKTRELSVCKLSLHWWHQMLSVWQPSMPPVMKSWRYIKSMVESNKVWRHDMETFCALLAICQGNPSQITGSSNVFQKLVQAYSKEITKAWHYCVGAYN